jgi:hypothetical protein
MKALTGIGIGLLAIVALVCLWPHLPLSWTYYQEIRVSTTFAHNLELHHLTHGSLPDENDWETLKRLNPIQDYEAWWPEYRRTGDTSFTLTFVEGFDPPYFRYDSKTRIWKKE